MRSRPERAQRPAVPRASLAIDNLRAVVILLVLAFHSVLAYLNYLPPHPFAFDQPPFLWRSFPIVDSARWMGFDLFCAWLDVFLMSFFFLLSGLFVFGALPNALALAGIALIVASGVAIILLDQRRGEELALTEAL